MEILDSMEAREKRAGRQAQGRTQVGSVEHFFERINVAAIKLSGSLKVGNTIEIENKEYTLRQKVNSMQIDRRDVNEASDGNSVGVKVHVPVRKGSAVYRLD